MSTALGCTNAVGSTTGVTPLMDQTLTRLDMGAMEGTLPQPHARVAKHPHPGRILAPLLRMPGHLHGAEYALRVRHQDREAAVGGREAGDPARRAVGIVWVALPHRAAMI